MKISFNSFHGNPSNGSHADKCGQTDIHKEATRLFFPESLLVRL